jgi:hypothetical protein
VTPSVGVIGILTLIAGIGIYLIGQHKPVIGLTGLLRAMGRGARRRSQSGD